MSSTALGFKKHFLCLFCSCIPLLLSPLESHSEPPYLHAASINSYPKIDPYGITILPDGKLLKPRGICLPLSRWPNGIAVSPVGQNLFVASEIAGQFITNTAAAIPHITPFIPISKPPDGVHITEADPVYSPDGKELNWSSGDLVGVYIIDVKKQAVALNLSVNGMLNGRMFEDSYIIDLKISADGKYLYGADLANFRVVVIDLKLKTVISSIDVGRYPYALAVSGSRIYVANIGMFAYTAIPPPSKPGFDKRGLTFPPYGFPSKEARDGVEVEGRWIPGLGDPNTVNSFSVWGIDVDDPAHPHIVSRLKPGKLVGAAADGGPAVGGSAPNFLAVYGNRLYISDDTNDTVEAINTVTGKRLMQTVIHPSPLVKKLRGVGPRGMVVSGDGKRLYVAEMGINAIGVIDTESGRVAGHIPTAWYPYRVALSRDGRKLFSVCFRGFGAGPRGMKKKADKFANVNEDPSGPGVLNIIDVPKDSDLPRMTAEVLTYNGMFDRSADKHRMASPILPTTPGKASSQIKYVVMIAKENHTFDTIFDHIPGANSDPSLLKWGLHQTVSEPGQPTLENAAVMTNHNALARNFTLSDNYYVQSEGSGVGHRWLVGVMPNNFCQMTYTLRWRFRLESTAPGRRTPFGGNSSIAPEDYPEAGSLWDHLARSSVSFRNYGEGFEFAGVDEDVDEHRTGGRQVVNIPMEKALFDNTCRDFPIFNTNIPDQYRAYWFEQDFTKLFIDGSAKMPSFCYIALCMDHGDDANAKTGYPYHTSYMVDNDLALGRIVEFLSHTKYWKNMLILVTEDDPGSEFDHVDAQRSVLLAISPWVKRRYVSHRHTTITSIHRTIYELLGLPPLSFVDALANDFSDCFTTKPDFTPYTHVPIDLRIFDPEKARDPKDPDYQTAARKHSLKRDDPDAVERLSRSR